MNKHTFFYVCNVVMLGRDWGLLLQLPLSDNNISNQILDARNYTLFYIDPTKEKKLRDEYIEIRETESGERQRESCQFLAYCILYIFDEFPIHIEWKYLFSVISSISVYSIRSACKHQFPIHLNRHTGSFFPYLFVDFKTIHRLHNAAQRHFLFSLNYVHIRHISNVISV